MFVKLLAQGYYILINYAAQLIFQLSEHLSLKLDLNYSPLVRHFAPCASSSLEDSAALSLPDHSTTPRRDDCDVRESTFF